MDAGGTVLIVDDEEGNQRLLAQVLRVFGYRSVSARTGAEAFERLDSSVDLMLLDLHLPDTDGLQVLRRLRSHPEVDIPVLVISGADEMENVVRCVELGAEDFLSKPLHPALLKARLDAAITRKRLREQERSHLHRLAMSRKRTEALLDSVVQIGVMMSAERDLERLLEEIVLQAKGFCNADAGTLYLLDEQRHLKFEILRTDSLEIAMGGTSGKPITFPPLHLYHDETGEPDYRYVVKYAALTGQTVNIPDAYAASGFDFSGTRAFDERTGYRSTSFLTVPLKSEKGVVVGVLQLINAQDWETGEVIPFDPDVERMVNSLSALATIALEAYVRECGLRRQIERLKIEVDEARKARQVAEITETDYFVNLQQRARVLRTLRD